MSDDDSDLGKFRDADDIRPIDVGGVPVDADSLAGKGLDDVAALTTIAVAEPEAPKTKTLRDGTVVPDNIADFVYDEAANRIGKGDYFDLVKKVPSLRKLFVSLGWDQASMEMAQVDVDLSLFLLGRDGQTREDSDFMFYNNENAADGSVRHLGDNRTGAGDGDNEAVLIDFEGLSFDVARIVVVITVYDENNNGLHLGMVRNLYLRIVNEEDEMEIVRYPIAAEATDHYNALTAIALVREGPRWFAEVMEVPSKGGLQELAQSYGIIVREATG